MRVSAALSLPYVTRWGGVAGYPRTPDVPPTACPFPPVGDSPGGPAGRSAPKRTIDPAERPAAALAKRCDDGDACHQDQGEHHRVLHGRRAVLVNDQSNERLH